MAFLRGDYAGAREDAEVALSIMNSLPKAVYFADVMEILLGADREDLVAELTDVGGSRPPRVIAAQLRQAQAMLSLRAGALEEGEAELRRAQEELAASSAPFLQARCELALGELLVDSGRDEEAEALLERSRQTFTRLGANFTRLGANAWLARRAARVG